jgi:hypothetical protein
VNVTWSSVFGEAGECVKPATGGRLATWTVTEAVSLAPLSSVTRSFTMCAPGVANVFVVEAVEPSLKSPLLSVSQA